MELMDMVDRVKGTPNSSRGLGGFYFAICVLHACKTYGGECDGHGHLLAAHLGLGAATRHINGHTLTQADLIKIRRIFAEGLLGPAAAFGVVIEHLWHATAVDAFEVVDVCDGGHSSVSDLIGHVCLPICDAADQRRNWPVSVDV